MILSKEDMFCWNKTTSTTAAYSDVLDFGKHGDDVQKKLFWTMQATSAADYSTLAVVWETSDYESFQDSSGTASKTDVATYSAIAATELTKGAFFIKNSILPTGLKRYNRLKLTATSTAGEGQTAAYPSVSGFIHDGRDEGTPFKGL